MPDKFKVDLIESERGWGQRVDQTREFNTYDEAVDFIKSFNSQNNLPVVPDWYMYATPANFEIKRTR